MPMHLYPLPDVLPRCVSTACRSHAAVDRGGSGDPPGLRHAGTPGPHRSSAFTLIELLVVMTIISILAALTAPMLANVQEKAKAAGCLSNQRNIGNAVRAYAADHNGLLIPVENDDRGGEGWAYRIVDLEYLTAPVDPTHNDITHRNTPFRCPSGIDEVTSVGATITSRDDPDGGKATAYSDKTASEYVHCWYGINGSTWGNEFWPFVQSPLDDGRSVNNQMSMVGSPSRVPMIYDGWWIHNGKDERIHARHNGGTTTSLHFFDGHVETLNTYQLPGVREQAMGAITWRIQ